MVRRISVSIAALTAALLQSSSASAAQAAKYDVLIRNGVIYDGSGGQPYTGDIGIKKDRIVYAGPSRAASAAKVIDAKGLAVAPGFINMLSWATESLLVDGLGQSDLRQGITLEVMGEGWSMGPLNAEMKKLAVERQGDIKYPITWTTLGDYLNLLQRRGVAMNVASFVGATTIRQNELGEVNVDPPSRLVAA